VLDLHKGFERVLVEVLGALVAKRAFDGGRQIREMAQLLDSKLQRRWARLVIVLAEPVSDLSINTALLPTAITNKLRSASDTEQVIVAQLDVEVLVQVTDLEKSEGHSMFLVICLVELESVGRAYERLF